MSASMVFARLLLRGKFAPYFMCSNGIKGPLSSHRVKFDVSHQLNFARRLGNEPDDTGDVKSVQKSKKLNLTTAKPKLMAQNDCSNSSEESASESDSSSDDESSSDEEIDTNLKSSVDVVAKSFKGDKEKMKSDLLLKLQEHVKLTKAQKSGELPGSSIQNLISELKVKSSRPAQKTFIEKRAPDTSRVGQRRQIKRQQQKDKAMVLDDFKLFQTPALGIFSQTKHKTIPTPQNTLFDDCDRQMLEQKMTYPPENSFEEMIRWTKEGKLWHFPINNEQGLEEEAEVGFHEHVFLEHLLTDFPSKGPVRHFMELVVTGLTKNPYITVAQKQEHIAWYKEYFKDKYKLIDELTVQVGQDSQQNEKL